MEYIEAKIRYKVKKSHPDYNCIPEDIRDGYLEFGDIYRINPDCFYGRDHIMDYIKNDLRLVAGGGYDSDHIYDVSFKIAA